MPIAKTINGFLPACFLFKLPRASLFLSLCVHSNAYKIVHRRLFFVCFLSISLHGMFITPFLFLFLFLSIGRIFRYAFLLYGEFKVCVHSICTSFQLPSPFSLFAKSTFAFPLAFRTRKDSCEIEFLVIYQHALG